MLKKYLEIDKSEESKTAPSSISINAILDYSKSLEVKKMKKNNRILIHLN